jgi:hypothetical protein
MKKETHTSEAHRCLASHAQGADLPHAGIYQIRDERLRAHL